MKATVKTQLGQNVFQFEIDEKDEMETLHKVAVLGNMPKYCNECKNTEHFRLDSNKDKEGNIYVNVVCGKCFAKAKLGQYKAGGYFWHKFEKYVKPGDKTAKAEKAKEIDLDAPPIDEESAF